MTKLLESTGPDGKKGLIFFCPGCQMYHHVTVERGDSYSGPVWTWNGDLEKPTVNPSLLINYLGTNKRCHLFVRDGRIQYLNDCNHALKGQTIDMEDAEA